jgi:uracil-DNA glycosylase family 4
LEKKPEDILDRIADNLEFFTQLGADFVITPPPEPIGRLEIALEEKVRACTKCRLAETRTQAVPGEGDWKAALMFVGEGPGRDEDSQGRPFVGRAGQLLTKIIKAMEFERSQVYITNVVKCRPPENRNPLDDEVEICKDYLFEQIRLISPRVIVTLGKVAADFFIPGSPTMGSVRGKFHAYEDIPLMPTYHPAYLIRNERNRELKRKVWEDMKQVMALLGR